MRGKERLREIRRGFQAAFWVANVTELFERLSYYAQSAVLAIFLHETLRFSNSQTGQLMGWFGFAVWFLPVLGGSLADRFGFRNSLLFAYSILTIGYFLMGSLGSSWFAVFRERLPLYWLVLGVLMVPALGPSLVKPVVAGTTARASTESVRSVGYSIYYTLVNVGGMLGPIAAYEVRNSLGIENVFRVSAIFVFAMFWVTLLFYREPARADEKPVPNVRAALQNMFAVLRNLRFVIFLLIFSGFWVMFWQEFIALPLFLRGYVDPNAKTDLLLLVDPATVIALQILLSYATRKLQGFTSMTLGIVITSASWLILFARPTTQFAIVALFVLAIGEILQSARYYEYVSRLAPSGQQGTYMGYAFLPVAIGYFIAGWLGGSLLHYFGDVLRRPEQMWLVISAIGFLTALMMWLYNLVFKPAETGDVVTT